MADPVTVNKFLAQPTRGSDVGTWDTPVNNNIGIIDNSFGGTATIALTNSPVTLSSAQYQCAFVRFTGAITANIPVTFPNVGSFYTIINDCTNSSAFYITCATTAAGARVIGLPPGTMTQIMTDGTNARFTTLPPVGTYWDHAGSSVPAWVSACTVPPWLNCDGTAFSSATYPALAALLGGVTLPDARGRYRAVLNQGTARLTTGSSTGGLDGDTIFASGGAQVTTLSSFHVPPSQVTDPGHTHIITPSSVLVGSVSVQGGNTTVAGGGQIPVNSVAFTGISVGSTSPRNFSNISPTYIGGITLVRAA